MYRIMYNEHAKTFDLGGTLFSCVELGGGGR
jgi:hypothetical protein